MRAAASGAQMMRDWAVAPQLGAMDAAAVHLINDADGAVVTPERIMDAVDALIADGVDQIIVYFAGHGLMVNMTETWLLSEAPRRGNAAISVGQSVLAARRGRTPHVVIISDACRTPAQQIDTQSLTAVSAFPNEPAGGPPRRVDVFYASSPGQAALEVSTVDAQGVFTGVLHDALVGVVHQAGGTEKDVFQKIADDDPQWYVFSGPLGEYLEVAVGERLIELNIDKDQAPTFEIQYGKKNLHWLARLTRDAPAARAPGPRSLGVRAPRGGADEIDLGDVDLGDVDFGGLFTDVVTPPVSRSITQIADDLFGVILTRPEEFDAELGRARDSGAGTFAASIASLTELPDYLEPLPSVRVHGAGIVEVFPQTPGLRFDTNSITVSDRPSGLPATLVVEFDNDTVAVVPTVAHHSTRVHIDGQQITALFFDPLDPLDPQRMSRLRLLRAVTTACMQRSRYRSVTAAVNMSWELQAQQGVDPTMALYAGYAYVATQEPELLDQMDKALLFQWGGSSWFDLALLAGRLGPQRDLRRDVPDQARHGEAVPPFPVLTQGWEMLPFPIRDADGLRQLRSYLKPSLWTVFDRRAAADVRRILDDYH
ncbi:hypothetical protein ASG82_18775 [Mycobacterium sp. Soil538]|nr:hypothetical protein ASG82_18775 [Mycobacterium sp. Soil538]